MKIKLTTGANVPNKNAIGGSVQRKPGWTGDVSDKFGRSLIEMGRAVPAPLKKQPKKVKVKLLQDLDNAKVGDEIEVTEAEATQLIAKEKAEPVNL